MTLSNCTFDDGGAGVLLLKVLLFFALPWLYPALPNAAHLRASQLTATVTRRSARELKCTCCGQSRGNHHIILLVIGMIGFKRCADR
jgi:hypothetical protein